MGTLSSTIDARSAVFTYLLCRRFRSYTPRVAPTSGPLTQFFGINGKYCIVLDKGILLLKDYELALGARTEPYPMDELQQIVAQVEDRSALDTEFRSLIDSERARYNTAENKENELLQRFHHGLFRLRRYMSWDYPFVVGLPKRFNAGKRGRRFFETAEAAATFIEQQLKLARTVSEKALSIPEADRLMLLRAREKLAPHNKTVDDAVDFYCNYLKQQEHSITLKDLAREWYLARQKDGLSDRHLDDVRSRMKLFREQVGNIRVNQVTAPMVDDYLREMDKSPVTRNNSRSAISTVFTFAIARGYLTSNPAHQAMTAKVIPKGPPGILRVPQFKLALDVVDEEFQPFLWIGGWAGLRRSELERLTWSHIHWERRLIEVEPINTKLSEHRYVNMLPALWTRLQKFRDYEGMVCGVDVGNQLEKLRLSVGLEEWPHNALRHSFASHHLAHFRDPKDLLLEMGDTDIKTLYKNYRHAVTPEEGRDWFAL